MLINLNETATVKIPAEILAPIDGELQEVKIKPLSMHSFQLIAKAAKDDHSLVPLLMIKESVVEPSLSIHEIRSMKVGLVSFLIKEIKKESGIV